MTVGGGPMNAEALGRAERILGTRFLRVFGMSECLGHTTPLPADDADDPARSRRTAVPRHRGPGRRRGRPRAGARGDRATPRSADPRSSSGTPAAGQPQPPELTADGFLPTGDRRRANEDGTINILRPREADHHPRWPQHRHQRGRGGGGALPGVAQVCVVPVPDELLGERAAALVVSTDARDPRRGARRPGRGGLPEVQVAGVRLPVDDLPQNRVGKLDRQEAGSVAQRMAHEAP